MSLKAWTQIFTLALIMAMFGLVDIYAEKGLLFPEISALALGFWIMEKPPWRGSNFAIWASPTLAALTGVLLLRYVPCSPFILIGSAFILVVLQLKMLRSSVYPSISAAILAIITHTTSWLYPLSVCILMATIVLGKVSLHAFSNKKSPLGSPVQIDQQKKQPSAATELIYWGKALAGVLAMSALALRFDYLFMIAPPLIVAFIELSRPHQSLRKKPVKVLLLIALSATFGVVWLHVVTTIYHGPFWLFSGLSLATVFLLFNALQVSFPPAAALALLPVLVPATKLFMYPLHVLLGCALFIIIGIYGFKEADQQQSIATAPSEKLIAQNNELATGKSIPSPE